MGSYGLSALSYRVKNSQCSLSSSKQQQIQAEESACAKKMIMSSPLQSLVSQQGSSSMMKHSYSPTSVTNKSIKFVCLPEGRVSKLYADRIERGESPQELMHQPIAWEAVMAQPVGCGPAV